MYRNNEGYRDGTAGQAIAQLSRKEKKERENEKLEKENIKEKGNEINLKSDYRKVYL